MYIDWRSGRRGRSPAGQQRSAHVENSQREESRVGGTGCDCPHSRTVRSRYRRRCQVACFRFLARPAAALCFASVSYFLQLLSGQLSQNLPD